MNNRYESKTSQESFLQELLIVVPHSGIIIPHEIAIDSLADNFPTMAENIDWYTNWLYDFRDLLNNKHIVFPYCSLILEANRHPEILDDSVPLRDINGNSVYKDGREPDDRMRKMLSRKYLYSFHKLIKDTISFGAAFLLDGHSTLTARGVSENQIDLMNFQHSNLDKEPKYYSPEIYIRTYAEELSKRLPGTRITVNSSDFYKVYGHVCAEHSINALKGDGERVPAIIQETNQSLYKNKDGTPNIRTINKLRVMFAESINATFNRIHGVRKGK